MPRISRREFLKLLAAGGIAAVAGIAGFGSLFPARTKNNRAVAQATASWAEGPITLSHPVHLALLPSGKVLYVAGSGFHRPSASGPFRAGIWNPDTNDQTEYIMEKDMWCSGQAVLANGNVLFVGGTLKYPFQAPNHRWWGLDAAYEFDFQTETFLSRPSMAHGRWYPTVVLLGDGRLQVVEGFDEFGYPNLLTEIYEPNSQTWSIMYNPKTSRTYCAGCGASGCANLPGAGTSCYGGTNMGVNPVLKGYPRMHLLPSGLVAYVGPQLARYLWDPATGIWRYAGTTTEKSVMGTSVLLPLQNTSEEKGKILICGGSNKTAYPAVAKNTAEILVQSDFKLISRAVQPMSYARRYCNPVILPTGQALIVGGTGANNDKTLAVYVPEVFDPNTETWTAMPPHTIPRIYHSGALLLADGRVFVAGSSYGQFSYELRTEIFSPSYVFEVRPTISGCSPVTTYGGMIEITSPEASEITAISIVRFSSTTHHYNTDQRLIWLQILGQAEGTITASAPLNSRLAPPGYYMLHILNSIGVPSKAAAIQVSQV